jgi:predicted dehydrogenase
MVRVGVLSAAHVHAPAYAHALKTVPNAELVGVWDDNQARGRAAADAWGVPFFETRDALFGAGLQAVVITSENVNHKPNTLAAAAAGLHVMCEKPLATSIEDAEAMIAACRDAGVQLMTAFPCRFSPAARRVKETLDSGALGKVLAIKGTNRGRNPGGWFNDLSLAGGGAVMDHTVHVADLIHWLTGARAKSVYAEIDNRIAHADFDDCGTLFIRYDTGLFATIDTSWSRPKAYPTWGDVTLEVIAEKGSVFCDLFAQHHMLWSDATGRGDEIGWGDDIDLLMVQAFVNAVENGAPVPITGEDGLAAARIALAAYRSRDKSEAAVV